MSEATKNTYSFFYRYTAISSGIAAAASYLTAPSIAATSFMQTAFGFSTIALQAASFSIAPAFIALAAYSIYNVAKNIELNIGTTPNQQPQGTQDTSSARKTRIGSVLNPNATEWKGAKPFTSTEQEFKNFLMKTISESQPANSPIDSYTREMETTGNLNRDCLKHILVTKK